MNPGTAAGDTSERAQKTQRPTAPSISLPKGGGVIRGIGEKFAANAVTGTDAMSVPIATSPGRSGFGPQLCQSYDFGAGNGPFGFGWGLSLPSITRKTDKGMPQDLDAVASDVFILSGAEEPWTTHPGSTITGCSDPSVISRQQKLRQTTTGNSPVSPPSRPDLNQLASTKPGAIHA